MRDFKITYLSQGAIEGYTIIAAASAYEAIDRFREFDRGAEIKLVEAI